MIDILLAHAYFLREDAAEQRVMKPFAPLGILSLSAWLKQRGFRVSVFDATFAEAGDFERALEVLRPPVVGISVNMVTKFAALRMLKTAKAAGCRVVLGGPEPASYAEEYLAAGADVVVAGEGEETLEEVLAHFVHGSTPLEDIAGVIWRDTDGNTRRNTPRVLRKSLDDLPEPDRGAIDYTPYFRCWEEHHGVRVMSIVTMRGCPYTCTWCSHTVYGESYRRRSPALVAEEIAGLLARYTPDALWFADDVFTINHAWIFELERELRARALSVPFECITRADRLTPDVVRALASMGCRRVWLGAESGSQRVLDAMRRGVSVEQVETMTRVCREHGIEVGTFIMLGYLGEKDDDILATARYLRRSRPDIVLTTVAYPIKGTRYHVELGAHAVVPPQPFETWNDRNHIVTGRYSDRYYWFANRYVVNEAAVGRALSAVRKNSLRLPLLWAKARTARLGMMVSRLAGSPV